MSETLHAASPAPAATCPTCGARVERIDGEPIQVGTWREGDPIIKRPFTIRAIPTPADPLTALERARDDVVRAAVEEINRRWENLGYFIATPPGQRVKLKAHKMAIATASMALSDAVERYENARAAAGTGT